MPTTVVQSRGLRPQEYDQYIGRTKPEEDLNPFANPFWITNDQDQAECDLMIRRYYAWLRGALIDRTLPMTRYRNLRPVDVLIGLRKLKGAVLACPCPQVRCHGLALSYFADHDEERELWIEIQLFDEYAQAQAQHRSLAQTTVIREPVEAL
jgi:hypothetical protein